ncbi:MAG: SMI1/KNR4 family protein [Verrucomicrobiaceae bacterium]|nr:MAG: SMI1/KNR4 family protein [Verrucomicrobiaceae bacterium]
MFDYAAWVSTALNFVLSLRALPGEINVRASVAPPLTRHKADTLARRLPMGLPKVMRDFHTRGSSHCDCHYWWEPPARLLPALKEIFTYQSFIYGGPVFCPPDRLANLQESRLVWAEMFDGDDAESRRERRLWTQSTPFANIGNGDLLALGKAAPDREPPVVYLCHDGGSKMISRSFTGFLRHWEIMSYIGPEGWLLGYWENDKSGCIDSAYPKSQLLRDLLATA